MSISCERSVGRASPSLLHGAVVRGGRAALAAALESDALDAGMRMPKPPERRTQNTLAVGVLRLCLRLDAYAEFVAAR